jgi:hypothetical protein
MRECPSACPNHAPRSCEFAPDAMRGNYFFFLYFPQELFIFLQYFSEDNFGKPGNPQS